MRLRLAVLLLATSAFTPAFAADIAAVSRVDAVTVYPAGAEVTRLAETRLEAGEHTLIFDGLPGDLDPATLRVEGSGGGRIEIGSVDSRLVHVPSADTDARRQSLEKEIESLQDERNRLDQAVADAEYQKSLMQQLAASAFTPAPKENETHAFGPQDLGNLLDLVAAKLQAFSKIILDARLRQRDIDQRIEEITVEIGQLAPQDETKMRVSVHLAAPAATSGTFRLKYRIAGAGWRPIYDARLASPDGKTRARIELVRRAEVMQSTTEAWTDVALTLSTARPLGATAAPELRAEPIGRSDDLMARGAGGTLQKLDAPAAAPEMSSEAVDAMRDKKENEAVQRQAEVEIAGFQALYAIAGRVSVDNTGSAKKVRIATDDFAASLSALAVPKLDPNAYLTAAFTLDGDTPLLPGPVMLYRDGVFMGQGGLPLLSPGEEAKLGFGADDLVKVKRVEVKRMTGEEGLITAANVDIRAYDISVSNLHDFALPVTVVDQMPYSTIEDITVETLPGMTPASHTDFEKKRGVLAWDFELAPKAEKVLKHGFKIAWPKSMTVGMNLN